MSLDKLIEIKGLYYYRTDDDSAIFEDVSAELYGGEKVAIIGPLGSGKSSLVRLILGLDTFERGNVYLVGRDIRGCTRLELDRLRQGIGVIFESAALISNLKVIENVILPLQYHTEQSDDEIMERAAFLLNYVGYRGDIWMLPGPLPFYTKKTIAMARAMTLDPAVMIYDRPMEGLDAFQGLHMLGLVEKFHKEKNNRLSILMANDEVDIKGISVDRILRIENRRILQ